MPTVINKQRILTVFFTALKKRYHPPEPEQRPVLEQFLYGICREGVTREQADLAYNALRERFFDWNEIRVSSPREIEEVLAALPDAEVRAHRVISLLQEVFETTYSFDLEGVAKKGVKQAAKHLARYQGATDFAVSWVVQQSLGGHAIALDGQGTRVMRRLQLLDGEEADAETLRASLEHLIPKAKGELFVDLLSALADEFCHEDNPNCSACPMSSECAFSQEHVTAGSGGGRSRAKPR